MDYTVRVIVKQAEMTDSEKADRITQFNQAFVTAAVDYYSNRKSKTVRQAKVLVEKK